MSRPDLREHDPAPRADVEERHRVEPALPDLVHHAAADRRDAVGAGEAEAALDLGVQPPEVRAEGTLVDRAHGSAARDERRQRAAEGIREVHEVEEAEGRDAQVQGHRVERRREVARRERDDRHGGRQHQHQAGDRRPAVAPEQQEDERESEFRNAQRRRECRREPIGRDAGVAEHGELVGVPHQQLRHEPVVGEHQGQRDSARRRGTKWRRAASGDTPRSSQRRRRSKLQAVAHASMGRKTTRSKRAPARPKRVR